MIDVFKPIEWVADFFVYNVLKLQSGSKLAGGLHFFVYDSIKILILILLISFIIGLIRTYFTTEKTKKFLTGKHMGLGNILAALLGVVTPFCSCSAVPFFIGMVEGGIPLGVTFSFLISAPMTNEVAIVLLLGIFGLKVTALYIGTGLTIAVLGGMLIGVLKLERHLEPFMLESQSSGCCGCKKQRTFLDRIREAKDSALSIFKRTWPYILIGVGIGAFIHGYIPTEFMLKYAGKSNFFAVPMAVMLGVPLYSSCGSALPIAYVLVNSGLPIGTVLAFTMAVTAISLPELIILRRVMKIPLLAAFVAILTVAIIFTGYLFNSIL